MFSTQAFKMGLYTRVADITRVQLLCVDGIVYVTFKYI